MTFESIWVECRPAMAAAASATPSASSAAPPLPSGSASRAASRKAGADLNIVDRERHTALIIALTNGHFDVAGRLIDHGADLDMQDEVGQTALWAAVDAHTMPDSNRPPPTEMDDELSAWDIVAKLVEAGADVDVPLRAR